MVMVMPLDIRWSFCTRHMRDGVQPEEHRWDDVITRMWAWEMTQYDQNLMLNGDSLVKSLGPVFDSPAGRLSATKPSNDTMVPPKKSEYMNAGFFVIAPPLAAFKHCKLLIDTPFSLDTTYLEQNLMNFVHSWDGRISWSELAYTLNIHCPKDDNNNDMENGVYSVYEEWSDQPHIYNEKKKHCSQARTWDINGWDDAWERTQDDATPKGSSGMSVL